MFCISFTTKKEERRIRREYKFGRMYISESKENENISGVNICTISILTTLLRLKKIKKLLCSLARHFNIRKCIEMAYHSIWQLLNNRLEIFLFWFVQLLCFLENNISRKSLSITFFLKKFRENCVPTNMTVIELLYWICF